MAWVLLKIIFFTCFQVCLFVCLFVFESFEHFLLMKFKDEWFETSKTQNWTIKQYTKKAKF